MYSQTPKILHKILGKEIILFAVDLAHQIKSREIIVVADKNINSIKKIAGRSVKYVLQPKPLGTGDAAHRGIMKARSRDVLIMNGDVPMLDPETIKAMIAFHNKNRASLTFLSCEISKPEGYGRIIRKTSGSVQGIIEHTDANTRQRRVKEINVGVYFGDRQAITRALRGVNQHNEQGEFYLTDVVGAFLKRRSKVFAYKIKDEKQIMGINTKYELACVRNIIKEKWYRSLMEKGVLIEDPESTTIDLTVKFSKDVQIKPNVIIEGRTVIKKGAVIKPFTWIKNGITLKSYKNV